ncbi:hypothetical protein ACFY94_20260 [Streptomyces griseorubiginosus]
MSRRLPRQRLVTTVRICPLGQPAGDPGHVRGKHVLTVVRAHPPTASPGG